MPPTPPRHWQPPLKRRKKKLAMRVVIATAVVADAVNAQTVRAKLVKAATAAEALAKHAASAPKARRVRRARKRGSALLASVVRTRAPRQLLHSLVKRLPTTNPALNAPPEANGPRAHDVNAVKVVASGANALLSLSNNSPTHTWAQPPKARPRALLRPARVPPTPPVSAVNVAAVTVMAATVENVRRPVAKARKPPYPQARMAAKWQLANSSAPSAPTLTVRRPPRRPPQAARQRLTTSPCPHRHLPRLQHRPPHR